MPERKIKPARLQSPAGAERNPGPPNILQLISQKLGLRVPQTESEWEARLAGMPGIGPMMGTTVGPKAIPLNQENNYIQKVIASFLDDDAARLKAQGKPVYGPSGTEYAASLERQSPREAGGDFREDSPIYLILDHLADKLFSR